MINKDSLKARANNISRKYGISHNTIYNCFFFDAFLSRLAVSKYKDQFILKGGLYLSSLLGIENRNTIDIDFHIQSKLMEQKKIIDIITNVINIDIEDGISFKIIGTKEIRPDDYYGGYQIDMECRLDNVRQIISIDVATGDPIVPSERSYDYKCLVSGEVLPLKAYSLESVVAEKLETVLSKGIANSRSKDYYDLFFLRKTQLGNIDRKDLIKAYKAACEYRNFSIPKHEAFLLLEELRNNIQVQKRWAAYCLTNKYAEGLSFDVVINSIQKWVEEIIE